MVMWGWSDLGSLASYLVFVRQTTLPINQLTQQGSFLLAALAGLAVLYAVGLPYMAMILNGYMGKGMDLSAILWAGMLPFLPGDALKILVTALLTPPIRRALDNSAK